MKIALFSPNQNPYSETFIQAHKNYLKGDVFFYYGRGLNIKLENHPKIGSHLMSNFLKVVRAFGKKSDTFVEEQLVSKSLKKNKIDVVLVEYGHHANHLLPIIKRSGLPLVVHFHGYDASVKELIEKQKGYTALFNYASKIIAVSRDMEQKLLDLGCPKDKLCYNANAAQPEFLEIVPTFAKKQFISIGRFKGKKAPYYTILAFMEVLQKHPDAKLLMAGNGVLHEVCENLVNFFGLENNVRFLGVITPEECCKLMESSLAYVQHSITTKDGDMEGMPISILEASSAGLPVIATFHAGIKDVIIHEENGLLCNEHDVKTMGQHMLRLLDDLTFSQKLGTAGKARIKSSFNFDQHISGIQQVLESVLR
jgi:glycosyltransferase involved in cell wall biosynthesis